MSGLNVIVWFMVLVAALGLWNHILGSLGGVLPEFFAYAFAYGFLFVGLVGFVWSGFEMFTEGKAFVGRVDPTRRRR